MFLIITYILVLSVCNCCHPLLLTFAVVNCNVISVYKLLENHLSELLWVFSGKWHSLVAHLNFFHLVLRGVNFNRLEPMYHLSDSNIIVSRRWHNAQIQQGRSCTSTGTGRFYNTNTGIALVQSINAKRFRTFGEMALDFVKNQISLLSVCIRCRRYLW